MLWVHISAEGIAALISVLPHSLCVCMCVCVCVCVLLQYLYADARILVGHWLPQHSHWYIFHLFIIPADEPLKTLLKELRINEIDGFHVTVLQATHFEVHN